MRQKRRWPPENHSDIFVTNVSSVVRVQFLLVLLLASQNCFSPFLSGASLASDADLLQNWKDVFLNNRKGCYGTERRRAVDNQNGECLTADFGPHVRQLEEDLF